MRTSQRVLTTGIVVTAIAGSYAGATAATRPAKAASATFGTPVVVDHFRPGYEPDLAVAKAGAYKGATFASVPNGFSTTMSYIWGAASNRRSFHMVEGNALGKSTTCVGGGDSEMQIDPVNGSVYFNDLQGLTNFSNSRSDDGGHTWQTSCTSVPGAGVDRQWLPLDSNGGTPPGGPRAHRAAAPPRSAPAPTTAGSTSTTTTSTRTSAPTAATSSSWTSRRTACTTAPPARGSTRPSQDRSPRARCRPL